MNGHEELIRIRIESAREEGLRSQSAARAFKKTRPSLLSRIIGLFRQAKTSESSKMPAQNHPTRPAQR